MDLLDVLLIVLAAGCGALTGPLLARTVFRLSVEPGEEWRPQCTRGHPWPDGPRGWLGPATRCARCARRSVAGVAPAGSVDAGDRTDLPPAPMESDHRRAPSPPVDPRDAEQAPPAPPARWPLALAGALCGALLAATVGDRPELAIWLLLVPGMVAVTAVDIAVLRLPDPLTLSMAALTAVGLGALTLLPVATDGSWPRALGGGLALAGALLLLALLNPRGMGLGDVKLSLSLGAALAWYGWTVLVAGVFLGFLLGALWAAYLVVARGAGRKTSFSMGPFLALGALAGLALAGLAGAV